MLNAGQGIFLGCLIDVKATMRVAGKTAVMEIMNGCAELVQSWHVRALESRIGDIDLVWKGGYGTAPGPGLLAYYEPSQ